MAHVLVGKVKSTPLAKRSCNVSALGVGHCVATKVSGTMGEFVMGTSSKVVVADKLV
jgi:hypothetical protein